MDIMCSFCHKEQKDVWRLIAGKDKGNNSVYICNNCVLLCLKVLEEEMQKTKDLLQISD